MTKSRTDDRWMIGCLKFIRGAVAIVNIAPYTIVVSKLIDLSGLGFIWDFLEWLRNAPGFVVVEAMLLFAAAIPFWYILQRMETLEGRESWFWKTFGYTVDVIATVSTFPPIVNGWDGLWLFLLAPNLSDLNGLNIAVNLVALFAWEIFDNFERHYFGPQAKYNFWGLVQ